jgi:hypothetical protein
MVPQQPRGLVAPKILESRWRQLRVAHGVLDVAVAELGLQRSGVGAVARLN